MDAKLCDLNIVNSRDVILKYLLKCVRCVLNLTDNFVWTFLHLIRDILSPMFCFKTLYLTFQKISVSKRNYVFYNAHLDLNSLFSNYKRLLLKA